VVHPAGPPPKKIDQGPAFPTPQRKERPAEGGEYLKAETKTTQMGVTFKVQLGLTRKSESSNPISLQSWKKKKKSRLISQTEGAWKVGSENEVFSSRWGKRKEKYGPTKEKVAKQSPPLGEKPLLPNKSTKGGPATISRVKKKSGRGTQKGQETPYKKGSREAVL